MANTSSAAAFYDTFRALKSDTEHALNASPPDASAAAAHLASLRAAFAEVRPRLPAYDQRSYDLQVRELETRLSSLRAEKPKSKFAFKRGSASASSSRPSTPSGPSTPAPPPVPAEVHASTTYTLSACSNTRLTPGDYSPCGTYTLTLASLSGCIIDLRDSPGTLTSLHARDLRQCVVLAPVMAGSVMLSDLADCLVVLGGQQFRLHSSKDVVVLLHVLSLPVIEHCERIHFGGYPFSADGSSRHGQVQDFDWVRSGPSPNWSTVDAETLHRALALVEGGKTPEELFE